MSEALGFDELRQRRLRYVESARENDFEEGLKSLLSELYPDNAHFIYELLQNAEDARAKTVEFTLSTNQLTVTHDGERAFSIADIESITGIGKSTKKDDPTQIGKFGVGFKAVFAYTTRPEIRSGAFSFAIIDLFVPEAIDRAAPPGTTTFAFPFDRTDKPAATARDEVERALAELNEKTLLFLNHISTITYELPDGRVGIVERQNIDDRFIRIRRAEGDDFVTSEWLRLTGPTRMTGTTGTELSVAAAFKLAPSEAPRSSRGKPAETESTPRLTVVPVDQGDVSIYFPAVKEASGLRFHIHAPFASTVARDSVRDDPANGQLVEDIAQLVVTALPELCVQGFVDDSFLATLPNDGDPIGHPYSRIRDAITEAFNTLPITPVRGVGGSYAPARDLVSSPSEFRNLLDAGDLPVLFSLAELEADPPPRWIRDREGRAGRFLAALETREFGWDELRSCLENARDIDDPEDPFIPQWLDWLGSKSDVRMVALYELIGRGRATYQMRSVDLTTVPIVRLRRRGRTEHVKGPETYLPANRSDTVQARVPIELAYFDDDEDPSRTTHLRTFYRAAGVKRWDEDARIEQRLAAYHGRERDTSDSAALSRHLDDVRSFVRYGLANRGKARQIFHGIQFLQAPQSQGGARWVSPSETFLDLPFRSTGLSALYPRVPLFWKDGGGFAYDQAPYPLAGIYLDVEGIEDFLEVVGARVGVEITKSSVISNPQLEWSWRNQNRENSKGQRVDWTIDQLPDLVGTGDPDLLRTLWNTVVSAPASKAVAIYQANGSSTSHRMESQLAQILKTSPWVLDRNGDLKRPREVTVEDLPNDWEGPSPSSLVHKLDFGADAARRRQKREGVSDYLRDEGLDAEGIELLRELKEQGLSAADAREWLASRLEELSFPGGASVDPERRAEIAARDALDAPHHETTTRERNVVEGQGQASAESKAYLRNQYIDAAGRMVCQVCQRPMPFRTRDGQWYFEAVRLVGARRQVHTSNALALCPLCAAMYKHARATTNDELLEQIVAWPFNEGSATVEVSVVLDGKHQNIKFTGRHAIDVQAALQAAGADRDRAPEGAQIEDT